MKFGLFDHAKWSVVLQLGPPVLTNENGLIEEHCRHRFYFAKNSSSTEARTVEFCDFTAELLNPILVILVKSDQLKLPFLNAGVCGYTNLLLRNFIAMQLRRNTCNHGMILQLLVYSGNATAGRDGLLGLVE